MPNDPTSQRNLPGKPLFHAISCMSKNEGYMVHYPPQYRAWAQAAIAQLSNQIQNNFVNQPLSRITPHIPTTNAIWTAVGHIEELDKWFGLHFSTPFSLSPEPNAKQSSLSTFLKTQCKANQLSNYKLLPGWWHLRSCPRILLGTGGSIESVSHGKGGI